MTFVTPDYLSDARERVTWQFVDKPVFDKHLQLMLSQKIAILQVLSDLYSQRGIDTALGAQLDVIGRIVGVSRYIPNVQPLKFFAFDGYPNGEGFVDNPTQSTGKFRSAGQSIAANAALEDEDYRKLIKARILKNSRAGTVDDILESVNILVPLSSGFGHSISEIPTGFAQPRIIINLDRDMSPIEQRLVLGLYIDGKNDTLLPKPAGVTMQVVDSSGTYNLDFLNQIYQMYI